MCFAGHEAVEGELVGGGERGAGVVGVAVDVVWLDGVEALGSTLSEAMQALHDRCVGLEQVDVEHGRVDGEIQREARELPLPGRPR